MATDSRIYESIGRVEALRLVMGEQNTPRWEQTFDVPYLDLGFDGVSLSHTDLDRHYGPTREARAYQVGAKWAGRQVRNERQLSIATHEDLVLIAQELGIVRRIQEETKYKDVVRFMSECLAVNLVIGGRSLEDYMGPGTKLFIGEPDTGAIVDISEAHLPCKKPATAIAASLGMPLELVKKAFKTVAAERRGFVASIYSPGRIALNDTVDAQLAIDHRVGRRDWKWPNETE